KGGKPKPSYNDGKTKTRARRYRTDRVLSETKPKNRTYLCSLYRCTARRSDAYFEISKYASLRRAVHRYKLNKYVRFFGFVPDKTLAVLYRLARVFVFPSLYEGFGFPPLEAMACGTPVITSNVSSLPEVVGDAALLIDPLDPTAIAQAIRRVLMDSDLRDDLRQRGLRRVKDFSWERSVRRVREIYEEVLAE